MTVKEMIKQLQYNLKPDDILIGDVFCYHDIINIGEDIEIEVSEANARELLEYMDGWGYQTYETIKNEISHMASKGWIFNKN
jgi:hypothetical protein